MGDIFWFVVYLKLYAKDSMINTVTSHPSICQILSTECGSQLNVDTRQSKASKDGWGLRTNSVCQRGRVWMTLLRTSLSTITKPFSRQKKWIKSNNLDGKFQISAITRRLKIDASNLTQRLLWTCQWRISGLILANLKSGLYYFTLYYTH